MAEATIPEDTAAQLERIRTITQTARATWFGYLGAVAFTAVTLMGVEDVDFFALDSATQLPLIGISVPVRFFFGAGALIITVIFAYLHVFLEQLWYALGRAPARVGSEPLATHVHPWLVSSFALYLRRRRNGDDDPAAPCSDSTPLGWVGVVASALLLYGAGPVLLGWLWYRSMPAHDAWMTGGIGILFGITLLAAWESGNALFANLRHGQHPEARTWSLWHGPARRGIALVLLAALAVVSAQRTEWDRWDYTYRPGERDLDGDIPIEGTIANRIVHWFRPVPADLAEARLVALPADWRSRGHAMRVFYAEWCARPDTSECSAEIPLDDNSVFQLEWAAVRKTYLDTLPKPILKGADLSFADLSRAHLPGIDLRQANLNRANFSEAQMEGADLREARMIRAVGNKAKMQRANVSEAEMRMAELVDANMPGALLIEVEMQGAILGSADLQGAILREAKMQGANLSNAKMQGIILGGAEMHRVILGGANMQDAHLFAANMQEVYLVGANLRLARLSRTDLQGAILNHVPMQEAELSYSLVVGSTFTTTSVGTIDLSASINMGGAFRFLGLNEAITDIRTDLRNSFGDGSVTLPSGMARPCQWAKEDEVLDDDEFYGRWRGWLEAAPRLWSWTDIAPEGFENIPAIPPPSGCTWNTDPLPTGP